MKKNPSNLNRSTFSVALSFSLVIFLSPAAKCQSVPLNANDSTARFKNNIKFNVSAWILYDNVFMLSYERTINKHQTAGLTFGSMKFPSFNALNINNTNFQSNTTRDGFMLGGEYRFYLAKENKYPVPHGLYLGPYLSYYHFNNNYNLIFTDSSGIQSSGDLKAGVSIFNVGIQIGYQFVLWKRITLDLVLFAPSFSRYSADLSLSGNIDPDHANQINDEVLQALRNRFPLLDKLISDQSVHVSGGMHSSSAVWAPGFRYSMLIGFRF